MQGIPVQQLRERVEYLLINRGFAPENALPIAESLVLAEMRGVASHGLIRLPIYLERVRLGSVKPQARPVLLADYPALALLDAQDGHGIPSGLKAMELAIEKAQKVGLAAVGVRRSSHFGLAWYFVRSAVDKGLIGVALSNADALVAPWGARGRFLGTNPLAVGIPAMEEPPIALDMATSEAAHGKILLAKSSGKTIPRNWALDAEGRPTDDPDRALAGALLPFGGPKGSAISLLIDVLCGPLVGALIGPEIAPLYTEPERPQGLGHFFMALNPAVFGDAEQFRKQIDAYIRRVRALPPAENVDRVLLPGEREWHLEQKALQEGVQLSPEAAKAVGL